MMKKVLVFVVALAMAWCGVAQRHSKELHQLVDDKGLPREQPVLVTPNTVSNVRIRIAPSLKAPQAEVGIEEGDIEEVYIDIYLPFATLASTEGEQDGWYKLGDRRWVSGSVTRVSESAPLSKDVFDKVYQRAMGFSHGSAISTMRYRVSDIGDGLFLAEELTEDDFGMLYLGKQLGNVLVFPIGVCLYSDNDSLQGLVHEPKGRFSVTNTGPNCVQVTYGDSKAKMLSDGYVGPDYAKFSDKELMDMFGMATLPLGGPMYLNSELLDEKYLLKPSTPLLPDGTPDYDAMLVGRHYLSLQWISWKKLGEVEITKNADGTYNVDGVQDGYNCSDEQEGRQNKDYLYIKGKITVEDKDNLLFDGIIDTKVYHIAGGRPCQRNGTYHFKCTKRRAYWRLQEWWSPCEGVVDYVDIYKALRQ